MGRIAVVAALLLAVCAAAAPAGTEPERVYALLSESQPVAFAYAFDGDRITVDLAAGRVIGLGAKAFPLLR